jgi:hypothetical protein
MGLIKTFVVIFLFISLSFSQPVNISGTVMDNSTLLPIVGAEVRLSGHGLVATTDNEGNFSINDATSTSNEILSSVSTSVDPAFHKDGTIRFSLENDGDIAIETYSLQGKRLFHIGEHLKAGSHEFHTPIKASGMYIHRITINGEAYTIKKMGYGNRFSAVDANSDGSNFIGSSERVLGKKLAVAGFPDTLRIRHELYARDVEIPSEVVSDLEIGILAKKPRVVNTTDLMADVDDEESMVRQVVMSNEFDFPAICVVSGCWRTKQDQAGMNLLTGILSAYEQAYDNLKVHTKGSYVPDFPTPEHLKSLAMFGQTGYGMDDVGNGKDSKGSDVIVEAGLDDDPRPLWVTFWGGANTLAQALYKVENSRTNEELKYFLNKIRAYDILGQDETGAMMTQKYGDDLLYIRARGVYNWQPSDSWFSSNVQGHGPLGTKYPTKKWAWEGDTPAFMHLVPNGLHDPSQIDQGGWGGRFSWQKKSNVQCMDGNGLVGRQANYQPFEMYTEAGESNDKSRWSDGYNNDFAARMDWNTTSDYSKVNHHPVAVINTDTTRHIIEVSAAAGEQLTFDASGSFDPDGNQLSFKWEFYKEPSSSGSLSMAADDENAAVTVTLPSGSGNTAHIVLYVKDNGNPSLTMYRRIVMTVE